MTTIAKVTLKDYSEARVFFDDGWGAYGWRTDGFTNGPYATAEEAADALSDEVGGKASVAALDRLAGACRKHDAVAA